MSMPPPPPGFQGSNNNQFMNLPQNNGFQKPPAPSTKQSSEFPGGKSKDKFRSDNIYGDYPGQGYSQGGYGNNYNNNNNFGNQGYNPQSYSNSGRRNHQQQEVIDCCDCFGTPYTSQNSVGQRYNTGQSPMLYPFGKPDQGNRQGNQPQGGGLFDFFGGSQNQGGYGQNYNNSYGQGRYQQPNNPLEDFFGGSNKKQNKRNGDNFLNY